jgi:hypothetical protein
MKATVNLLLILSLSVVPAFANGKHEHKTINNYTENRDNNVLPILAIVGLVVCAFKCPKPETVKDKNPDTVTPVIPKNEYKDVKIKVKVK